MARRGMTLIELIISLAITAILASTVLLSFSVVERKRLETEARNLAADLAWARSRATSMHTDQTVAFDTVNDTYVIYNGSAAPANLIKSKISAVDLASATFANLTFESHTGRGMDDGSVRDEIVNLSESGRSRTVSVIGATGFIKVE